MSWQRKLEYKSKKNMSKKSKKWKLVLKLQGKNSWRKRNTVIESYLNFDKEISLSPLKKIYSMLEVALKNDQRLIHFVKAKWHVLNSTMFFSIFFPCIHTFHNKIFLFFQVIWAFQDHKVWSFRYLKHTFNET